jgi:hypothetical protein
MRAYETVHAEPNDSIDRPSYRVNFWSPSGSTWGLDAWVLVEARDINEVLQWAEKQAEGRRFEVFVEMDEEPLKSFHSPRTSGLIRLYGSNPNTGVTLEFGRLRKL